MKAPPRRKGNIYSQNDRSGALWGLNESPSKKEGKSPTPGTSSQSTTLSLNESPSKKEGKSQPKNGVQLGEYASMKAPPRRKGNEPRVERLTLDNGCLNESPSKKEGKSLVPFEHLGQQQGLNESPSKKEGKCCRETVRPSRAICLNESPSKKEGKFHLLRADRIDTFVPQ